MDLKWSRIIIAIACVVVVSLPARAQQGVTSRVLLRTTTTEAGQPLQFSLFRNQVTAVRVEVDPGRTTGATMIHVPAVLYILEGLVSMEREGQPPKPVSAGQPVAVPFHSPLALVNRGTAPVKLLIVFFGEAGKPNSVPQPSVTPGVRATVILNTTKDRIGEPILFPTFANQFLAGILEYAPGGINPRHIHPHTGFAYILEGTVTLKPDGLSPKTGRQGDVFVEPLIPHVGTNPAATPARLFFILVGEAGMPPTTYLPQP